MKTITLTENDLTKYFDHTFLKPFATSADMEKLCAEAKQLNTAMVAINPVHVELCKELLLGSDVHVGAAIGFPLGQNTIETKVFETNDAIEKGADEIDYVINIGKAKEHDWEYLKAEMEAIVAACKQGKVISKVIFENCYLEKDEIKTLAGIAKLVGPDYIKTSTGFGSNGATVEDVTLMKENCGEAVKVKAAGGIRDWETCKAMINAGASRIGTSSSIKILEEFKAAKGA